MLLYRGWRGERTDVTLAGLIQEVVQHYLHVEQVDKAMEVMNKHVGLDSLSFELFSTLLNSFQLS